MPKHPRIYPSLFDYLEPHRRGSSRANLDAEPTVTIGGEALVTKRRTLADELLSFADTLISKASRSKVKRWAERVQSDQRDLLKSLDTAKDLLARQEGAMTVMEEQIAQKQTAITTLQRECDGYSDELAVANARIRDLLERAEDIPFLEAEADVINEQFEQYAEQWRQQAFDAHYEMKHDGTFQCCTELVCRRSHDLLDDWLDKAWHPEFRPDEERPLDPGTPRLTRLVEALVAKRAAAQQKQEEST